MSQTRTNLSKTWLQTWSKARFAAGWNNGMWFLWFMTRIRAEEEEVVVN